MPEHNGQPETHGQRAARVFASELAQISDQRIKDFVIRCFDEICPDYFWERPTAKGDRYHPAFVGGPSGLVRHVRYGAWWVREFLRAFNGAGGDDMGDREIVDSCIAALLMHDMVKDGDPKRRLPKSPHKMSGYHGVELMDAIWDRVLGGKIEYEAQILIMYGVAGHMGVWTIPDDFRPCNIKGSKSRKVATIVHMADYAASRRVIEEIIPSLTGFMPQ